MAIRNRAALLDLANALDINANYNQRSWGEQVISGTTGPVIEVTECTTKGCLAGHTVMRAHYQPRVRKAFGTIELNWNYVRKNKEAKFQYVADVARKLLGLSKEEAKVLFDSNWLPRDDMSVQDALRKLADGASVESVTEKATYAVTSSKLLSESVMWHSPNQVIELATNSDTINDVEVEYV